MNERKSSEGYQMPGLAEEYLWRYGMDKSNVDPIEISQKLGIKVITYREAKELIEALGFTKFTEGNDGFCVNIRNSSAIFYDDTRSPERQRATIAHELGHFVNGDLTKNRPPCKGHHCDHCKEWRADSFALNLLF